MKDLVNRFKPGIPRRHLLLAAAFMWCMAGGILLERSIAGLAGTHTPWYLMTLFIVAGLAFFFLLFLRISFKHIHRIRSMEILRPCIFSFFDFRGYIMMALMITLGLALRKSGIISVELLCLFYLSMGIPLLLSAARFFIAWWNYPRMVSGETIARRKVNP